MGEWGGSATEETFWLDLDGDGLGSGTGYSLCNGLDLTGWVTNNDDSDDNCASNEHDCAGVCDGTSVVDECGECGGGGIDEGACDCAGNVLDCNEECGGNSVEDDCGVCEGNNSTCSGCTDATACNYNESSSIEDGSCTYSEENFDCENNCLVEIDCAGVCGGDSVEDNCETCDNNSSNDMSI